MMEIELTVIDDKAKKVEGKVAIRKVTFFNIDFVEGIGKDICNISSSGITFTVMEGSESVKNKIRGSNMRESSLIVNI